MTTTQNPPRSLTIKADKQNISKVQVGTHWGRLTILSVLPHSTVIAKCDCGETGTYRKSNVATGVTASCGCLHRDRVTTHGATAGYTRTPEWGVWRNLYQRCTDPNHPSYPRYGGRGITICPQWLHDFPQFLADVGMRPTPQHTLDRIDNESGYEPGNVRWLLRNLQNSNKSSNIRITVDERTQCLARWAEESGVNYQSLYGLHRRGGDVIGAIKAALSRRGTAE